MKDIPIFTGCDGIATLILRQIPYRGEAYVLVRSVFTSLEACLHECESFCRAAGADRVYFSGNADFSDYCVYASLIERKILRSQLPQTTALAIPTQTPDEWVQLYHERFRNVPAASCCRTAEKAYDIVKDGIRIGIGQIDGDRILSLASIARGNGTDCLCALAKLCEGDTLRLLCAQQNIPAMKLYDKLGFSRGETKEVWYCKKTLAI